MSAPAAAGELRVRPRRLVRVCGAVVDVLLYVAALPESGGDVVAERRVIRPGGGFNILVGARRLGLEAAYGGLLGDGPFARLIATAMETAGIASLLDAVPTTENGLVIGLVEPSGERTFVTSPGVEADLEQVHLAQLPIRAGDTICISGYDLCYPQSGASLAAWAPTLDPACLLAFDPGPLVGEIAAERLSAVLGRADIASVNRREARILLGGDDPAESANALASRLAPSACAVVRCGADGCWIAHGRQPAVNVPPRPARVIDTTGAGDTHLAAVLARLAAGDTVVEAARRANIAASLAVEQAGPNTGPTAAALAAEEARLAGRP
jgi:sugar/nucleoside kinase (ribokinase family)